MRNSFTVTFSVWYSLFLREALDRLFGMRASWCWLIVEPLCHIAFLTYLITSIRMRTVAGIDPAVWVSVGLLGYFLFRRTAVQAMHGVDSNKPLFAYRQVKPVDATFVRGFLELFLMTLISVVVLLGIAVLRHDIIPTDPLLVMISVLALWMLGLGYGLISSVLIILIPETAHILKIVMLPLYVISGVIFPISSMPIKYRAVFLWNPICNGLEVMRFGFNENYHIFSDISICYVFSFATVMIFIGLLLHYVFAARLMMK